MFSLTFRHDLIKITILHDCHDWLIIFPFVLSTNLLFKRLLFYQSLINYTDKKCNKNLFHNYFYMQKKINNYCIQLKLSSSYNLLLKYICFNKIVYNSVSYVTQCSFTVDTSYIWVVHLKESFNSSENKLKETIILMINSLCQKRNSISH